MADSVSIDELKELYTNRNAGVTILRPKNRSGATTLRVILVCKGQPEMLAWLGLEPRGRGGRKCARRSSTIAWRTPIARGRHRQGSATWIANRSRRKRQSVKCKRR